MGWAFVGVDEYGRESGYGIGATCDKRGCDEEINRGLGYCCGPMHGGDDGGGCGRYYCGKHVGWAGPRGGCPHRGRKAWGRTKCQLLRRDDRQIGSPAVYYCACHEFTYDGPPLDVTYDPRRDFEDPILANHLALPGYEDHLRARGFSSYV